MTDTCKTCRHFMPLGTPPIGEPMGNCLWEPPPFIERMVAMLNAEPATQIAWQAQCDVPPKTPESGHCSAWSPNEKIARLRRLMT